jgi:hypothetical protein
VETGQGIREGTRMWIEEALSRRFFSPQKCLLLAMRKGVDLEPFKSLNIGLKRISSKVRMGASVTERLFRIDVRSS